MRATRVENISGEPIELELKGGARIKLPPGTKLSNVDVQNIESIRSKVKVTEDLGEVGDSSGKQNLTEVL